MSVTSAALTQSLLNHESVFLKRVQYSWIYMHPTENEREDERQTNEVSLSLSLSTRWIWGAHRETAPG